LFARVAAVVAALVLAAACAGADAPQAGSGAPAGTAGADQGATRSVEHTGGSTRVPSAPQRVATTSEVIAGHLATSGLLPVAGPDDVDSWLAPYAEVSMLGDLDPTAIEKNGTSEEPDLERLATLEPDLVLIEEYSIDHLPLLSEIAPTVVVSRPTNADWKDAFDQTVDAAGITEGAEQVRQRYADRLAEVTESSDGTVVTFLRGSGPGAFRLDVLGGFGGSVAEEAGYAVDVGGATAEEAADSVIEFSNERLDVVSGDLLVTTAQEEGGPSNIDELRASPLWENIPAVQAGRVIALPQPVYNGGTYVAAELLLEALAAATRDGEGAPS